MKSRKTKTGPIAPAPVKERVDQAKLNRKSQSPSVGSKPLDPPSLYQDSGNGYNPDRTFIQR